MVNIRKPKAMLAKMRAIGCRDDEYEFVKSLDPKKEMSFKRGFVFLLRMVGYEPDVEKMTKKLMRKEIKENGGVCG